MSGHRATPDSPTTRILGALIAWNVIDIVVHIAADEVEILRVAANLLLIIVEGVVLLGVGGAHPAHLLVLSLIAFVVLNLVVLIDKGPAVPMVTFIAVSAVLTAVAIQRLRPALEERQIRIFRR